MSKPLSLHASALAGSDLSLRSMIQHPVLSEQRWLVEYPLETINLGVIPSRAINVCQTFTQRICDVQRI